MGLGYTRQSSAEILTGEDIEAAPLNSEFNAIESAFDSVAGHTHDGTLGEGPKIDLETGISGVLPTTNGGIGAKHNPTATVAPTVNDDSGDGYGKGSTWTDTTNLKYYVCMDATTGAANWIEYQKFAEDTLNLTGAVVAFARNTAPTGWLKANGAAVSRTTYSTLFNVIGTTFGDGDGSTTFNIPDLRGEFIRGWADDRTVDTSRVFGSDQADAFKSHTHTANADNGGAHTHTGSTATAGEHTHTGTSDSGGAHTHTASTASSGAHSHTITVNADGGHSHTASTNSAGSHNHSGSTSSDNHNHSGTTSTDSHSHYVAYGSTLGGNNYDYGLNAPTGAANPTTSGIDTRVNTSADSHNHSFTTSSDSHSHTFTTGTDGAHTHTVTVDAVADHTHTASSNSTGAHTHTVTVDAVTDHTHTFTTGTDGAHTHTVTIDEGGAHTHTVTVDATGDTETRPRNIALLYCIRYL